VNHDQHGGVGLDMKRLPIATFCAFLLMATSILLPSAIEAKKLKWKPITANQSGVVLDIEGYETKYRGTGWDSNYAKQIFRAYLGNSMGPLHIVTRTAVLASGYVWLHRITNCESNIRRASRFRNSIVQFSEITGNSKAQSYDSNQKFCGARYEIAYYSSSLLSSLKHCYYLSSIPHFGETADFNPSIQLEICAKEDLNLSIKNPEKFFIIDDRNEKVRLDLSYQNLGQKIAALKNPTPSTSSSVKSGLLPSTRNDSSAPKWPTSTRTEKRPIAINWEGKNQLMLGQVELPVSGAAGKISFSQPNGLVKCSGTFSFKDRSSGVWAAACTTEETLSGSFISPGQGKAITGTGTDREGNAIKFTVGPR